MDHVMMMNLDEHHDEVEGGATMKALSSSALSLNERIAKARKSIEELHKETLNQVSLSSTIVEKKTKHELDRNNDIENDAIGANQQHHSTTNDRDEEQQAMLGPMTNLRPGQISKKVSLELSMELFGRKGNEGYIHQKMSDMEAELQELKTSLQQSKSKQSQQEATLKERISNDFLETEEMYNTASSSHPPNDNRAHWDKAVEEIPDAQNPSTFITNIEILQLQCSFLKQMKEAVQLLDATFQNTTSTKDTVAPTSGTYTTQAKAIAKAADLYEEAKSCYMKQHEQSQLVNDDRATMEEDRTTTLPQMKLSGPLGTTLRPEQRAIWTMLCNNNAMLGALDERLERHASAIETLCTSLLRSAIVISDKSISIHLGNAKDSSSSIEDSWQALLLLGKYGRESSAAPQPPKQDYYECNYVANNLMWEFCEQIFTNVLEPLVSQRGSGTSSSSNHHLNVSRDWKTTFHGANAATSSSSSTSLPLDSLFRLIDVKQSNSDHNHNTVSLEWSMVQDNDHDTLHMALEYAKSQDVANQLSLKRKEQQQELSMIEEQERETSLDSSHASGGSGTTTSKRPPSSSNTLIGGTADGTIPKEAQRWKSVMEALKDICTFCHDHLFVDIDDFPILSETEIGQRKHELTNQPPLHKHILTHMAGNLLFVPSVALNSDAIYLEEHSKSSSASLTPSYKTALSMTDVLHFHFNHHCLPLLPEDAAKCHDVFVQSTTALEDCLRDHHYLVKSVDGASTPSTDDNNNNNHQDTRTDERASVWLLKGHIQDYVTRCSERREHEVLLHARYLLKDGDYHSTRVVGETIHPCETNPFQQDSKGSTTTTNQDEKQVYYKTQMDRDLERAKAVFTFPKCVISDVAYQLFDLVQKTMEEACEPMDHGGSSGKGSTDQGTAAEEDDMEIDESTNCVDKEAPTDKEKGKDTVDAGNIPSKETTKDESSMSSMLANASSSALYRAARGSFDLYRFMIPSLYQKELRSLPRTAAICHNDCVYLAHKCTTLGIAYQDRLIANDLAPFVTFMDLVPLFRDMGDGIMMDMIKLQCLKVESMVKERLVHFQQSLGQNEANHLWTEVEKALRVCQHYVNQLSKIWKPTLASSVYRKAMGSVVNTVLHLFLQPVLDAKDISESACTFVSSLFRNAQMQCVALFSSTTTRDSEEEVVAAAQESCLLWDKFTKTGELMNMSLADIQDAIVNKQLKKVFANKELSHLIMAVFDDSDRRDHVLQLLAGDAA